VKILCQEMNVSRSGYYKWYNRKNHVNIYEQNRILLTKLLEEQHQKHKAAGYHMLAYYVRIDTGWMFSDNLAHKCCKFAGIKSKAKHYRYKKSGEEHVEYENIIRGRWNATRPLEIVCSDMTCLFNQGKRYEWTYILDTFNNEIIASSISGKEGDAKPYFDCLKKLKEKLKEQTEPVILHTDQGSVYSSKAFSNAHTNYNIKRSMSRVGTPTDNPIIEAENGWIKAELKAEEKLKEHIDMEKFIEEYVEYFNNARPSWKLKYKTPIQYRIEQGF